MSRGSAGRFIEVGLVGSGDDPFPFPTLHILAPFSALLVREVLLARRRGRRRGRRMRGRGIDPAAMLSGHDAWSAFKAVDDLFVPGPTGTNVNDFRAILLK